MYPRRIQEPLNFHLRALSKLIPDAWIDSNWPQRRARHCQGNWAAFRTSQLVRCHLLTLIEGLGSFNQACRSLAVSADYKRFCRILLDSAPPTAGLLSEFRDKFDQEDWRGLQEYLLGMLFSAAVPSPARILMVGLSSLVCSPSLEKKKSKQICLHGGMSSRFMPPLESRASGLRFLYIPEL